MATNTQRAQSICDALLNKAATTAQINRLGQALAEQAALIVEYEAADNQGKAGFLVAQVRKFAMGAIRQKEGRVATDAARASANATADADFSESP